MEEFHQEYKDEGFTLIGIAVQAASLEEIKNFQDSFEITYPILVDDGKVSRIGYNVTRVPTNYLIDRDVRMSGPFGALSKDELTQLITPML